MAQEKAEIYPIGELARRSGVSVKTIPHYSDAGLLPPAQVTGARYRLYSDADWAKLELIRTLRAAGFDLPTIGRLLREELPAAEAVRLQLEAVEAQLEGLRRRRAGLGGGWQGGEGVTLGYLDRVAALARLEGRERAAFLRRHLERAMEGVPVDPRWKEAFCNAATPELPDEPTDEQLAAWLELAELVADETFLPRMSEQSRPFWEAARGHFDFDRWSQELAAITAEAAEMDRTGQATTGDRADRLLDRWLTLCAQTVGQEPNETFAAEMLARFKAHDDPRAQRYWELVAVV